MGINTDKNKKTKNNKNGFTLVELLVVISIIAILSAILMPNLFAAIDRAKEARNIANLKNAKTQALMDMLDGEEVEVKEETIEEIIIKLKGITSLAIQSGTKINKKDIAQAIADSLGERVIQTGEFYTITGVEIPGSTVTRITVDSSGNVYLKASHVSKEEGERLSQALGYGKLPTPQEVLADSSLKNENIFWSSSGLSVGGHIGKPAGHLDILLYKKQ